MTINDTAQETTPAASSPANLPASPKWFAVLGLITGFGAVVASSCCAIPLGLAALGAGAGVLGGLEAVAEWRAPLLLVSAMAIVGGWGACWLKRAVACAFGESCASPQRSRATLALLLCASVTVVWRLQVGATSTLRCSSCFGAADATYLDHHLPDLRAPIG
ncbi:MAG: mercury transporter MerT [Methylocystis sp.]|uniref:mercury transporter MerT n=1 Tax=Methylocystis sp. TaxID=1911079 RepID=UPI003DA6A31C